MVYEIYRMSNGRYTVEWLEHSKPTLYPINFDLAAVDY